MENDVSGQVVAMRLALPIICSSRKILLIFFLNFTLQAVFVAR